MINRKTKKKKEAKNDGDGFVARWYCSMETFAFCSRRTNGMSEGEGSVPGGEIQLKRSQIGGGIIEEITCAEIVYIVSCDC